MGFVHAPTACAVLALFVAAGSALAQKTTLPSVSGGATLVLQLDADVNVTTGGGGVVNSWTDANGNPYAFARQAGDPTQVPAAINGQSVIRFTSGNGFDRLLFSAGSSMGLSNQQTTIFAVTQNMTILNGLLDSNSFAGSSLRYAFGVVQVPSGTIFSNVSGDAAGSVSTFRLSLKDDPSTGPTTPVRTYETFLRSDTFDGPLDMDFGGDNLLHNAFGNVEIGTINNGTLPSPNANGNLNGDVAELVIYRGALSDADRLAVASALASAYAVPEPAGLALLAALPTFFARRRRGFGFRSV